MKYLLSLVLLTVSSLTFACANFSGEYRTGPNLITITQQGCEEITVAYADHIETYQLDNVFREVSRTNQYVKSAAAYMVKYSPIIMMRVENNYSTGYRESQLRRLTLFSTAQRPTLIDELAHYRRDGVFIPFIRTSYDKIR
jgi:hypothetical protein